MKTKWDPIARIQGATLPSKGSVRLVSLILATTILGGCATTFNSDISKTIRSSQVVLPTCDTKSDTSDKTPSSSAAPLPKQVSAPDLSPPRLEKLRLSPTQSATDLAAGLKILRSVETDKDLSGGFSELLGLDLSQFSSQVPWIHSNSIDDANEALRQLKATGLSSADDLEGKTFVEEDYVKLVAAVSKATASYGWTAKLAESLGQFAKHPTQDALVKAKVDSTFAAYFIAYFRDGKVFDVQFDSNDLKQRVDDAIKNSATRNGINIDPTLLSDIDTQFGQFISNLDDKLCKSAATNGTCTVLGGIGEKTFVTRAGKSLAFSGITLTLDPEGKKAVSTTKPNYLSVGEDLLRVFIEAAWDSENPVPGVDNSTLCAQLKHCAADAADQQRVAKANTVGDTTEAATSQAVSIVIRGGWLFSLNNEAAAEALTTGISVVSRKIAERVAYAQAGGTSQTCDHPGTRTATISVHGRGS